MIYSYNLMYKLYCMIAIGVVMMFCFHISLGQGRGQFDFSNNMRIDTRTNIATAIYNINSKQYRGTPEQIARAFITENKHKLGVHDVTKDIEFVETKSDHGISHILFRQNYKGIPVHGSETVVSTNGENKVTMVINGHKPDIRIGNVSASLEGKKAIDRTLTFLKTTDKAFVVPPASKLVLYQDSLLDYHVAWKVTVSLIYPYGDWLVFVDGKTGEIISARDITMYYGNGTGRVFDLDPITSCGTGFRDYNDENRGEFYPAYKTVTLLDINDPVNGIYKIQGRYARSDTIEQDDCTGGSGIGIHTKYPVENSTSNFSYNRSQPGFEEVNIYYFLDLYRRYIGGLGYSPQWNGSDAILFDAHGMRGENNAKYSSISRYLAFGDGKWKMDENNLCNIQIACVDAGEDQDAIVHEYGHALHDALMPGDLINVQYQDAWAVSEGLSDFLANSFRVSRDLNQPKHQPDHICNWFGNGECWDGRTLNSTSFYPANWEGDIHTDGGITWASTLRDIQNKSDIGRDITTKIVLSSLGYVTVSSISLDYVQAIFQADRDLYNGIHLRSLGEVFLKEVFLITVYQEGG